MGVITVGPAGLNQWTWDINQFDLLVWAEWFICLIQGCAQSYFGSKLWHVLSEGQNTSKSSSYSALLDTRRNFKAMKLAAYALQCIVEVTMIQCLQDSSSWLQIVGHCGSGFFFFFFFCATPCGLLKMNSAAFLGRNWPHLCLMIRNHLKIITVTGWFQESFHPIIPRQMWQSSIDNCLWPISDNLQIPSIQNDLIWQNPQPAWSQCTSLIQLSIPTLPALSLSIGRPIPHCMGESETRDLKQLKGSML